MNHKVNSIATVAADDYARQIGKEAVPIAIKWKDLVAKSSSCKEVQNVLEALKSNEMQKCSRSYQVVENELSEIDGVLLREGEIDDTVYDKANINDAMAKLKCKEYADARRGARESEVEVGDEVLLREEDKGKLSCNFGNDRHVVTSKQGSDIVCENPSNGKVTRRNSTFVKVIPKTPSLNKNDSPVGNANTQQRPQRVRKQPDWYGDVVIHALDE
ncbi:hypothetical protein EB796_018055 [Bugula neritina]|uniref:Uncharacterized protein n=1 Tax=Bugula neritina TaxID=10212 RepID=A0A7J7JE41_BUGNE|nr:hypothetical protein EB796_018055 [Bugula neritina]